MLPDPAVEKENALRLTNEILSCQTFDELAPRALQRIMPLVGAETGIVIELQHDGERFHMGRCARHEVADRCVNDYVRHFVGYDPVALQSISGQGQVHLEPGRFNITSLCQVANEGELLATPYYNDFLRPQHIHHVLALFFRPSVATHTIYGFGFHRPRSASYFSERELGLAGQIAPSLFASVNSIAMMERLRAQEDVLLGLSRATDEMEVMIVDQSLRLCYANDRAMQTFGLSCGMARSEGAISPAYNRVLDLCLKLGRGKRLEEKLRESACGTGGGGEERLVTVQMFENAASQRRYLITICSSRFELILEGKMDCFGMTRRETDIVRLVAAGATNSQIAEQLCISTRTVENHLRSIFSKADVHSRTQLVRMLMSGEDARSGPIALV